MTTPRNRPLVPAVLASVLGAALLAACAAPAAPATQPLATPAAPGATAPAATTPAAGATAKPKGPLADTVTFSTTALNGAWDPQWTLSNTGMQAQRIVNEALVILDDAGRVNPLLATSWRQVNPTTVEFTLRPGVRFHDGAPLNADAVVANVQRMLTNTDPQQISTRQQRFSTITGASKTGDMTVEISSRAPDPILLNRISNLFLISPAQVGVTPANLPIGTGPFVAKEFVLAERMVAEANPNYWGDQKPQFRNFIYRQVPEQATAVAGVRTGEIDVAYDIPPDTIQSLRQAGAGTITRVIADVNVVDLNPAFPALADVRVRQALNFAVDKDAILQAQYLGQGRPMQGQLAYRELPSFNPQVTAFPYDPAQARRLLQEAGVSNLRLTAGGSTSAGRPILEPVQAFFQQVGVQLELNFYPFARYAALQNNVEPGKDPVWHTRTNYFNFQDIEQALLNYTTNAPSRRYANPEFDAKITQAQSELNPDVRNRLFQEAAMIMRNDPPTIVLHQHGFVYGVGPKLQGLDPLYDASFNLLTVYKLQ